MPRAIAPKPPFAQSSPSPRLLKVLAIALPATAVIASEILTGALEVTGPHLTEIQSHGLFGLLLILLTIPFSIWVFRWFDRVTETLTTQRDTVAVLHWSTARQGARVSALNEAGLALASNRSLQEVLELVVGLSLDLLRAQCAELTVTDGVAPRVQTVRAQAAPADDGNDEWCAWCENAPTLRAAIVYQGQEVGNLVVRGPSEGVFVPDDEVLLKLLATHAAVSILNARLRERDLRQSARLRALNEAGLALASNRSLQQVLEGVVQLSVELLQAQCAELVITDTAYAGVQTVRAEAISAKDEGGAQCEGAPTLSVAVAYHGREIGSLVVRGPRDGVFVPDDAAMLQLFAAHAAVAIFNARLRDREATYAALEERARIGRELHDSFGQVLGYVSVKVQVVEQLVGANRPVEAAGQLVELREAVSALHTDVREEIFALRSASARGRGFSGNLEAYVRQFERSSGITVTFEAGCDPSDLASRPGVEAHLTRIVQEALTNVRKHAHAQHARVRIDTNEGVLRVAVSDDGVGFVPADHDASDSHFGLHTMQERAALIGGALSIVSRPAAGTCIELTIPVAR